MRKGLFIILTLLFGVSFAEAQNIDGARLPARTNVVPYDDEDAIVKNAYRESPYYMELTGRWDQKQTDSSRVYSREIEVEKYWKDYRVTLQKGGISTRNTIGATVTFTNEGENNYNDEVKFALYQMTKIDVEEEDTYY